MKKGLALAFLMCAFSASAWAENLLCKKVTIQVDTQEWAIEIQGPQFLTEAWFSLKGRIELAQVSTEQKFNLRAKRKNGDFLALMVELPCMNAQELSIIYTDAGLDALFIALTSP